MLCQCSLGRVCLAQYEDPTDVVQLMREKIELQRALKLEWLGQLAAKTARDISTKGGTSNGQSSEVTAFPILVSCSSPRFARLPGL